MSWRSDLNESNRAIISNKEYLESLFKGSLLTIEEKDGDLYTMFDQIAGFDWLLTKEEGIYGVATRVQWDQNWGTFTIMYKRDSGTKTEYEKRKEQIESGALYPAFTLQMYCDRNEDFSPISIGVCKTKDLFDYIEKNPVPRNRTGNAVFMYVNWKRFEVSGYLIFTKVFAPKLIYPIMAIPKKYIAPFA